MGYFLPFVAVIFFGVNILFFDSPADPQSVDKEFFDYDLTSIFGAIILMPVIVILIIYVFLVAIFYIICFLIIEKVATLLSTVILIRTTTDIVNNEPISIIKSFSLSACGKYIAYYLISFFGIAGTLIFSPYIVAEEPKISLKDSINRSNKLATYNNFKIVQKCRTICGAINLLGIISIIGIIPTIPFTILIKAVMYQKLKNTYPPPFTHNYNKSE